MVDRELHIELAKGISFLVLYNENDIIQSAYCYIVGMTTEEAVLNNLPRAETLAM